MPRSWVKYAYASRSSDAFAAACPLVSTSRQTPQRRDSAASGAAARASRRAEVGVPVADGGLDQRDDEVTVIGDVRRRRAATDPREERGDAARAVSRRNRRSAAGTARSSAIWYANVSSVVGRPLPGIVDAVGETGPHQVLPAASNTCRRSWVPARAAMTGTVALAGAT